MSLKFVPPDQLDKHLRAVEARWEEIHASGIPAKRASSVQSTMDEGAFERLINQAAAAKSGTQRIQWLHRTANVVSRAVHDAQAAPCEKGCSACCHIPVAVSRTEAAHIAKRSGRPMNSKPAGAIHLAQQLEEMNSEKAATRSDVSADSNQLSRDASTQWQVHTGTPCPFLSDDACSIWEDRPLACRSYFTLDRDNLLCQLTGPDQPVNVPMLNVQVRTAMYWSVLGIQQDAADIRDWFPPAA